VWGRGSYEGVHELIQARKRKEMSGIRKEKQREGEIRSVKRNNVPDVGWMVVRDIHELV